MISVGLWESERLDTCEGWVGTGQWWLKPRIAYVTGPRDYDFVLDCAFAI